MSDKVRPLLSEDIEKLRTTLLNQATGKQPTYSVRVDLSAKSPAIDALKASHTVYTRSSY